MAALKRVLSVRLTPLPADESPPPSALASDSYVMDGSVFVKDNVAILHNGVAMRDVSKTFVVDPETLVYGEVLGRGACSYVQKAMHSPTGTPLALKVINMYDKSKRGQLIREIKALFEADCDCLISFFGAFHREGAITIALEFMDVGALNSLVKARGPLPEPVLAGMTFQILWALAYLRVEKRLHRDLKPSNILINSSGHVKLSDFGLSAELQNSIGMAATFTGTCRYMSPERIMHKAYSFPADIWALGVVLVEAATSVYPFPECGTYIEMAEAIVEASMPALPADGSFSPDFTTFVGSCLRKFPEERVPADILLGSPWFLLHGIDSVEAAVDVVAAWLSTLAPIGSVGVTGMSGGGRASSGGGIVTSLPLGFVSPSADSGSSPRMHIVAGYGSAPVGNTTTIVAAAKAAIQGFDDSVFDAGLVGPVSRKGSGARQPTADEII